MDRYGERIKIARKRAGFTQEQLGKAIGVSGVAVMRYEKNLRTPSTETLLDISEALNCNFLFLIGASEFITEEEQIEHDRNKRENIKTAVEKKDSKFFYDALGLDYEQASLSGLDLIGTIDLEKEIDPEIKAALEASNRMIHDLQSNPRQFVKASEDELQKMGVLQFQSELGRIIYFYSLLNIDGQLTAGKHFLNRLSPDVWTEVADYVQNLSTIPQYQKSPSEDNQGNGDQPNSNQK